MFDYVLSSIVQNEPGSPMRAHSPSMVSAENVVTGKLVFTSICCFDLPKPMKCFAKISLYSSYGVETYETSVVPRTTNPDWYSDMPLMIVCVEGRQRVEIQIVLHAKMMGNSSGGTYVFSLPNRDLPFAEEGVWLYPQGETQPPAGQLYFRYSYTAPVGETNKRSMLGDGSFGMLRISGLQATGLQASHSWMSTDVYIICRLRSWNRNEVFESEDFGVMQEQRTKPLKRTLTPVWPDVIKFPVDARLMELELEVRDADSLGDPVLGVCEMLLPACTRRDTAKLPLLPPLEDFLDEERGQLQLEYDLRLDDWGELSTSFQQTDKVKKVNQPKPEFNMDITFQSLNNLRPVVEFITEFLDKIKSVLRWKSPIETLLWFITLLAVCYWGCFFQFGCIVFLFLMGKQLFQKKDIVGSKTSTSSGDEGDSGLGLVTHSLFVFDQVVSYVSDIWTWRDNETSFALFMSIIVVLAVSFIVPLRYWAMATLVYLFTLHSLYSHFPLFSLRFQPGRLMKELISFSFGVLGISVFPRSRPFRGTMTVKVISCIGTCISKLVV
eukprot:NODE_189_length_3303_cov_40.880503_g163_i0.p1 GENE.NODE_189_length_3303_cov_40.880503_g163_i0~~NODE_189_length_3303_cov_40.880503_g163_i0.p1  ORF type:complete len:552 (+),score=87.94 NODE_189_length_3303_cov_40.880503_g163_i0:597-2252(+)